MRRAIMSTFALTCVIPLAACGSGDTEAAKTSATTPTPTSSSAPSSSSTQTSPTSTSSSASASTRTSAPASTSTTAAPAPTTTTKAPSSSPTTTATKTTSPAKKAPATTAAAPVASNATLGLPGWGVGATNQQGFGETRPSTIYNGGDPTGLVNNVKWNSWGGKTATGTGVAEYVAPGQIVADGTMEPVKVVAFNLTTCGGHPAYRYVNWYFPAHGGTLQKAMQGNGEGYDLCNGN